MFNFIKKLFSKSNNKPNSIEITVSTTKPSSIPTISPIRLKSPLEYWNYWMENNNTDLQTRIDKAKWISPRNITIKHDKYLIQGTETKPYVVTLSNCTCPDFQKRKNYKYDYPCKHMCRLAIEKNILPDSVHSQKEIDERARIEEEEKKKLEKCQLPEEQITELLNKISEPMLSPVDLHNNSEYFYSDSFHKKESRYEDKIDDLLDSIRDEYKIEKIISTINKLQKALVSFKEFCYEYGPYGASEYSSLHGSDFNDTKKNLEFILRYDFPENLLSYQEESALLEERHNDKLTILSMLGDESIAQAVIIKQLFPNRKSYAQKLCLELSNEGLITRIKQGNKYILTKNKGAL